MMTQRDYVLWREWLNAWEVVGIVIANHMIAFGGHTYVYAREID